jgi:hypothetical protein
VIKDEVEWNIWAALSPSGVKQGNLGVVWGAVHVKERLWKLALKLAIRT